MQRSEAVPETRRLDIALLVAAFLAVLANACLFLYAALSRLTFPLELEANEDTVADCALQVLRGGGLYGEPTFEFIPTLYGPVHPYLLALFMRVLGTEFWVGRLLSVLASVVAAGFLGGVIARYAGRLWGFLFSLLMLGLYAPTGFWMDLVRVDALHMALTVSAVWCLDDRPGRARIFAGGLLLTASAFTKATTAPLVLLLPISVMLREETLELERRASYVGTQRDALHTDECDDGRALLAIPVRLSITERLRVGFGERTIA